MPDFPDCTVVGMHFRGQDAKYAAEHVPLGTELRLVRESDNKYDANALQVFLEDQFLGYIEAPKASWISPQIDDGVHIRCIVTGKETRRTNVHPICLLTSDDQLLHATHSDILESEGTVGALISGPEDLPQVSSSSG